MAALQPPQSAFEASIRQANAADARALAAFEAEAFDGDRISLRQFRYLLKRAHAETWVAETRDGPLLGYVTLLFSRGTASARLYSIAVAPRARGQGLAASLVARAEARALAHDSVSLRLEIRVDNVASQRLFRKLGYREFGRYSDYYEDHADALRLEKDLHPPRPASIDLGVPYYQQTLEFTCGPASLMMAMQALDTTVGFSRALELRLWREATTIFMTSGHGGCGPYGLALAALHRGFGVQLRLRNDQIAFFDSVRSQEKKEVIRIVQDDMRAELEAANVPIVFQPLDSAELAKRAGAGEVAVVLISSSRIYGERFPHWVVVTGVDAQFIRVHDPFVDTEEGEEPIDCMDLPIPRWEFDRMLRYGRAGLQAAVLLAKPRARTRSDLNPTGVSA